MADAPPSPVTREATPSLREDAIWAAGNPQIARTLPYAAPVINAEDAYIASQRAAQTQALPVATPKF